MEINNYTLALLIVAMLLTIYYVFEFLRDYKIIAGSTEGLMSPVDPAYLGEKALSAVNAGH